MIRAQTMIQRNEIMMQIKMMLRLDPSYYPFQAINSGSSGSVSKFIRLFIIP